MTEKEMLTSLLKGGFFVNGSGGLEWSYIEGTDVGHFDPILQEVLLEFIEDCKSHEGF